MFEQLHSVPCALCGSEEIEQLVPSRKLNAETGGWEVRRDLWICLCTNCGLVFENPQVDVIRSRDYNEDHYYNETYNQVQDHDALQNTYVSFRWEALKDRIDWRQVAKAVDVGATGAWSAVLKREQPHIESLLLEPSRAAIDYCAKTYPDVVPVHGILEEFAEAAQDLDLITLFYSLYHISAPLNALRASHRALTGSGRIMVCISHPLLELEMWGGDRTAPWVDMKYFVRGVMLTTFSRRTLQRMLQQAGFEVTDAFVATHTDAGQWRGRQDYFVLADRRAAPGDPAALADPGEVAWARDFVKNFCVNASRRAVDAYVARSGNRRTALVCDDDVYGNWAAGLLAERGLEITRLAAGDRDGLAAYLAEPGTVVLNATWAPLQLGETAGEIIDCIQETRVPGDYDLWERGASGEVIITKALLPVKDFEQTAPV